MEQEQFKKEDSIITIEVFMKKFSPVSMVMEYRHVKTVKDAIESEPNALSYYSKHVGDSVVIGMIEAHIFGLNDSINVKSPLKPLQMKEIAVEIESTFFYLSMAEIFYVFRQAKLGKLGKLYGALSMEVILDWFEKYSMERSNHFINNQMRVHDKYKDDSLRSDEKKELRRHNEIITDHKNKDNG